jgi:hypothetical protein
LEKGVRVAASEGGFGVSEELGRALGPVLNLLQVVSRTPPRLEIKHTTREYFRALINVELG